MHLKQVRLHHAGWPYASTTVNPGKAASTSKNAKKAKPKSTTKSVGAAKATVGKEKATAIPDIDFDEKIYCSPLNRENRAAYLQPLPLKQAVDRVRNVFWEHVGEKMAATLQRIVASSGNPYSEEVVEEIIDRFRPQDLLSPAATNYLAHAWVAYVLATLAYERGDEPATWYHLCQARFHEGRAEADYNARRETNLLKAAGAAGGRKTALKRNRLMRECFKLLADKRAVGWDSCESAYAGIATDLQYVAGEEGETYSPGELEEIVVGWIEGREDFAAIYEAGKN